LCFHVESIKSFAQLFGLIELFHDSEQFLFLPLLFKIDRGLVLEDCGQENALNDCNHERQGPDYAEVLVNVEIVVGVRRSLNAFGIGKSEGRRQRSTESQRQLIDCAKWTDKLNRSDFVYHLGAYNRERSIAKSPDEAANAQKPDPITNERDTDADSYS